MGRYVRRAGGPGGEKKREKKGHVNERRKEMKWGDMSEEQGALGEKRNERRKDMIMKGGKK